MACNSLSSVISHLQQLGFIGGARVIPNDKVTEAEAELKRLQKLAEDTYGIKGKLFEVVLKTTTFGKGKNTVVRINFNNDLFKVMDPLVEKSNTIVDAKGQTSMPFNLDVHDNVYKGEVYESKAQMLNDMKDDMSFSPVTFNPTNYVDVVNFKELILKQYKTRLNKYVAERKTNTSNELKVNIAKMNEAIIKTEGELHRLKNDPDIFEKTFAIFNNDLLAIDRIFSQGTPSLDNIHLIEEMITYFDSISDYSADNKGNTFVDVSNPLLIDPDVKQQLDKLRVKLINYRTKIYDAKREYLLKAIDESAKLKALYPGEQLEEIRVRLLSDQQDISLVSLLFGTVNEDFGGKESLLSSLIRKKIEDSRNLNKGFAAGLMQRLNFSEDNVKSILRGMGYSLGSGLQKLAREVSYDLFYQKNAKGNKTGALISKFSSQWSKDIASFTNANRKVIDIAFKAGKWGEINAALAAKYSWINERADFIELGSLPEIINNKDFSMFNPHFDRIQANNYKTKLIAQIGKYEYDKIVQTQTDMVEDYLNFVRNELQSLLTAHGVPTPIELPGDVIDNFNILANRNNPFKFLESHKEGQRGQIAYNNNAYQSHIKYNTYVPKATVTRITDVEQYEVESGYYDKDFSKIEANPDLLKFWETLYDSSNYMSSVLNDANTTLNHGSLLQMKKSMLDTFLSKEMGVLGKTGTLFRESGQTFANLFSTKDSKIVADEINEVAKSGILTIQDDVNKRIDNINIKISTLTESLVKSNSKLNLKMVPLEVAKIFEDITDLSVDDIIREYGDTVSTNILREYITNQVMEEQTFNLPVMMRAYLDIVSEYAAQKEALPEVNIFKSLYNEIGVVKKTGEGPVKSVNKVQKAIIKRMRKEGLEDKRWMAQLRMKTWINRNVKGITDTEIWGRIGGSEHPLKNYTAKEKELKADMEAYRDMLINKIESTEEPAEAEAIQKELTEVIHAIDNLGQTYAASAVWDSMINKLSLFVGIGLNVSSQVANRFMGYWTGMINDTGRYWEEGAFHSSNAFINRKGLRLIPGMSSYRNEIRKTKLMIEKLNTLQDATNELDRAKRNSGFRNAAKVLNPFYMVEYTEWHNQVPQILAMLQSRTLTSADGTKTVKVFNGTSFPAFIIQEGELVLDAEFDTPQNRATWVEFSNQESSDNKTQISQTIAILNGDYSKTGSTFIKSKIIGKTVMMFKTWAAKQYAMRFATNQTDLALGIKDYDGAYSGSMKSNKTRVAASVVLGTSLGITATMAGGILLGGALSAGLLGYAAVISWKNRKDDTDNFNTMKQLSAVAQGILRKGIGLPINAISGKNLIQAHKAEALNLTKEEKENLQMIINELVGLLYLTLIKVAIKAFIAGAPDDEDEPKTINGQPNPYYMLNPPPSKREKEIYNILENTITRLIEDATLWQTPTGIYTLLAKPAGTEAWFLRVSKLADGLNRLTQGTDELTSGVNAGKSKTFTALKEATLPAIMNEWAEGNFTDFGFGKKKEAEFNTNEMIDYWFKSDYAKDKKAIKSQRADKSEELTEYWRKQVQYDKADALTQQMLDSQIKKMVMQELNATFTLDIRGQYDLEQNKIDFD